MPADRLGFRRETIGNFDVAARERQALRRDLGLVPSTVTETAEDLRRIDAKLDATISNHGARLDKRGGAAE